MPEFKCLGNGKVQLAFANREEATPEAAYNLLLSHMHLKNEDGDEITDINFKKKLLDSMIRVSDISIKSDEEDTTSLAAS
jgi:hypothetical protein